MKSAAAEGKYFCSWSFPGLCFPLGDFGSWYWVNVMRIQPLNEDLISSYFSPHENSSWIHAQEPELSFPDKNFLIYHLSCIFLLLSLLIAELLNVSFLFFFCHQCSFHLIYSLMPQPRYGISKLFPWWQMGHKNWIVMELHGQGILGSRGWKSCWFSTKIIIITNSSRGNIGNLMGAWANEF